MDAREVNRQAERRWAEVSRLTQRYDVAPRRPGPAPARGRMVWTLRRLRQRAT